MHKCLEGSSSRFQGTPSNCPGSFQKPALILCRQFPFESLFRKKVQPQRVHPHSGAVTESATLGPYTKGRGEACTMQTSNSGIWTPAPTNTKMSPTKLQSQLWIWKAVSCYFHQDSKIGTSWSDNYLRSKIEP